MRLACLFLASFLCALASPAQDTFRAFASSIDQIEGGRVEAIVVVTGADRMTIRIPRGFSAQVEADKKSVLFTGKTNATLAITLRVTTNSAGAMPDDDYLKSRALEANPGGNVLQLSTCSTGYQPAKFVDTIRRVDERLNFRTRHAFVATPEGTVELIYSTNGDDFANGLEVFNVLLSSFQLEQSKQPAPTPSP